MMVTEHGIYKMAKVPTVDADPANEPLILLTDEMAARLLSISRATFHRRVKDGMLPFAIRLGKAARWRRKDIEDAVDRITERQRKEQAA